MLQIINKHKSSDTKLDIYSKPYVAMQQVQVPHHHHFDHCYKQNIVQTQSTVIHKILWVQIWTLHGEIMEKHFCPNRIPKAALHFQSSK